MSAIAKDWISKRGYPKLVFHLSKNNFCFANFYKIEADGRFVYSHMINEHDMSLERTDLPEKVIRVAALNFEDKKILLKSIDSREIDIIKGPTHQDILLIRSLTPSHNTIEKKFP